MFDCLICAKHRNLPAFTGPVIFEQAGLCLTHFPLVAGEPATAGRLVIEPRRHVRHFSDLSKDEAGALGSLIQEGERRLRDVLGAEHVYLFRINDKVEHLHFHLIPRFEETPKEFYGPNILKWVRGKALDLNGITAIAEQLKTAK